MKLREPDARERVRLGGKGFIANNLVGQCFHGVGLGPDTTGVRIDLYANSGNYVGSGGSVLDSGQDKPIGGGSL